MKLDAEALDALVMESLPVRGAWVEIRCGDGHRNWQSVAPRAGSVG